MLNCKLIVLKRHTSFTLIKNCYFDVKMKTSLESQAKTKQIVVISIFLQYYGVIGFLKIFMFKLFKYSNIFIAFFCS